MLARAIVAPDINADIRRGMVCCARQRLRSLRDATFAEQVVNQLKRKLRQRGCLVNALTGRSARH